MLNQVEDKSKVADDKKQRSQEFAQMNGVEIKNDDSEETSKLPELTTDPAPTEIEEIVTTRPVASHPILKGLTVSGGVLLLVIIFASMIGGLTGALDSSNNQEQNKTAKVTQESKAENEENEGDIKTAMAITSQKGELKAILKKDSKNVVSPQPLPTSTPATSTTAITVRAQPTPVYQAPPPAPTTVRPNKIYDRPPRQQFSFTPTPQTKPNITAKTNDVRSFQPLPFRTTPKDPMQEWIAAGNVGIYSSSNDDSASYGQPNLKNAVEGGIGLKTIGTTSQVPSSPTPNYDGKRVLVGTRAAGVLETPIAWAGSTGGNQNQQLQTLIRLVQPLKAFDGQEVLPKGSYIVASVSPNNSEIVQMTATAALINVGNKTQEKQLPPNSILILGKNGNLLKAESRRGGSSLGNSLMSSLLAGLSNAAEIQNRNNSEITISSGNTITSTSSGNRNVLAGFAEGSIDEILERMKSSNERQIQGIQQQQQVFVIEPGKEVQIFVNQSVLI